jgi:hypothetical protein
VAVVTWTPRKSATIAAGAQPASCSSAAWRRVVALDANARHAAAEHLLADRARRCATRKQPRRVPGDCGRFLGEIGEPLAGIGGEPHVGIGVTAMLQRSIPLAQPLQARRCRRSLWSIRHQAC